MTLTAGELRTRGRAGAYAQHAKYDTRETTKAGTAAFLARFEAQVDPDGVLTPEERTRRAAAARAAYFAQLQLKSAISRRASRGRAVAARRAHNPKAAGSSPAPATSSKSAARA